MEFDSTPRLGTVVDAAPAGVEGRAVQVQDNATGQTFLAATSRVEVIDAIARLADQAAQMAADYTDNGTGSPSSRGPVPLIRRTDGRLPGTGDERL